MEYIYRMVTVYCNNGKIKGAVKKGNLWLIPVDAEKTSGRKDDCSKEKRGVNVNKKQMSEQDIRTKYITPAILAAGWDRDLQIREEVSFTKGKITVRRKTVKRGEQKRADYILYWKPNIPLAIVEAKTITTILRMVWSRL